MMIQKTFVASIILIFGICGSSFSQSAVTNVDFRVTADDRIVISYDLTGYSASARFTVSVRVSLDNGRSFTLFPKALNGDVGAGISPGRNKTITWDVFRDTPALISDEMVIQVLAKQEATFITENGTPAVKDYGKFPKALVMGGGYGVYREVTELETSFKGKIYSGLVEAYVPGNLLIVLNGEHISGKASSVSKSGVPRDGVFYNTDFFFKLMKYFGNLFGPGAYAGIGPGVDLGHQKTEWQTTSFEILEFKLTAKFQSGYNFSFGKSWRAGPVALLRAKSSYGNSTVQFMENYVERKWYRGKMGFDIAPGITLQKGETVGKIPYFRAEASFVFHREETYYSEQFKETSINGAVIHYLPVNFLGGKLAVYANGSIGHQKDPSGLENNVKTINGGINITF